MDGGCYLLILDSAQQNLCSSIKSKQRHPAAEFLPGYQLGFAPCLLCKGML